MKKLQDIDRYIADFPKPIQLRLQQMRWLVRRAAREAQEIISYSMSAYRLHGVLVFLGAHKNHMGFYPTPSAIHAFKGKLAAYQTSKGAIQFPLDKPLPARLIQAMVKFRVKEDEVQLKRRKK